MSLLTLAEADNAFLLEDAVMGFGTPGTITEPGVGGTVHNVVGQYIRVAVSVDPGTGLQVAANKSAYTVRLSSLNGYIPGAGCIVSTTDITGAVVTGKVPKTGDDVYLDRTLGRVTILFKAE